LPNDGPPQSPEPSLGPFLASPCAPTTGMIAGHMTKLIINGAKGRMGQTLISCAARLPDLQVVAGTDVGDNLAAQLPGCDAVIDFTLHHVTADVASLCAAHGKALVIGTTGHSEAEKAVIRAAAAKIPMVWATNFSTGVNTLFWLTRKAAEILGPSFDLEVVEMHHRLKKDAPSGTATTLLEILADVRKLQLEEALRHGRKGITGERTDSEIGIHALRGGDVVGDHTVIFAANGERVELTHKASSRETFANGALRAAQWVVGRAPGIYDMQDVLGLK
jgi:4-hydroxy-tetrahydrodipicolinate reductase